LWIEREHGFVFRALDGRKIELGLGDVAHEIGEQKLGREAGDGDDIGIGKPSCARTSASSSSLTLPRVSAMALAKRTAAWLGDFTFFQYKRSPPSLFSIPGG
jgi:hypothetical protein